MITLVIHQNATKYFKDEKELKVEVKDYYSLMSFLVNSFPKFAELMIEERIDVNPLFSNPYRLENTNDALDARLVESPAATALPAWTPVDHAGPQAARVLLGLPPQLAVHDADHRVGVPAEDRALAMHAKI